MPPWALVWCEPSGSGGLDAQRHFTLILCGHEDLEGRLRTSWLAPLRQRITTWVRLGPLTQEEIAALCTPGAGGVSIELLSGPKIAVNATGIIEIDNGMGGSIQISGPQVSVNDGALEVV